MRKINSEKSGSEVRMENSIDAQQCEGGGGSVDWELVVMPLERDRAGGGGRELISQYF
jgi:hypothetical protein